MWKYDKPQHARPLSIIINGNRNEREGAINKLFREEADVAKIDFKPFWPGD